jgi:hypothetical protein
MFQVRSLKISRHTARSSQAIKQTVESAASSLFVGLATVCGHNDVPRASPKRSIPVESATKLRTSCHNSIIPSN